MKNLTLVTLLMVLAGCGVDMHRSNEVTLSFAQRTAPGATLPNSTYFLRCNEKDEIGRCKDWNNKSDMCVNPKGIDAQPPVVPCASIEKEHSSE